MNTRRLATYRSLLALLLLIGAVSSLVLGQEMVVLEHKVSGKRITGILTEGRINDRRVFKTESGESLFLNMGDWKVVETVSAEAEQSREDPGRDEPPAASYTQSQIAKPDKALALVRGFMKELEQARSSKYTQVQAQAQIEESVKRLRSALQQTPVLEFEVSVDDVKASQAEDIWRVEVSGPTEMPRTKRWKTSITANITKKKAIALNIGQKITVRFKAELIEVSGSATNSMFLLVGRPAGWYFEVGNRRCRLRLAPVACRLAGIDEGGEWIDGQDLKRAGFFGITSHMRRVVYVVDRSGSMTDSIDYAKFELKRSIGALDSDAEFHVIFYSSGEPVQMPPRHLVPASRSNKLAAFEFIDQVVAQGETDPSEALKRAFALHPTVIFVLTDGEFGAKTVGQIERLNIGDRTTVNTIGFLYRIGEKVLKQIAEQNNGNYKFVSEADLATLAD